MTQGKQSDAKKVQHANVPEKPAHETATELPVAAAEAHYLISAAPPPAIKPGHILALQRTVGNHATMEMMAKRNVQTVSLTNNATQMRGRQQLIVNGENHPEKSRGQKKVLIQRQITPQLPSKPLLQRDASDETSPPKSQMNPANPEHTSPDNSVAELEGWERHSEVIYEQVDPVNALYTALDSYIQVTRQECEEALEQDKSARLKLEPELQLQLNSYQVELDRIRDKQSDINLKNAELKKYAGDTTRLEVEAVKNMSADEITARRESIETVKRRRLKFSSAVKSVINVVQTGKSLSEKGVDQIMAGYEWLVDHSAEAELKTTLININLKYSRLVDQLVPGTTLGGINTLKLEMDSIEDLIPELNRYVTERVDSKKKAINLLLDRIPPILKELKTSTTSVPLTLQFIQGSARQGQILREYAESALAKLAEIPDCEVKIAELKIEQEQTVNDLKKHREIAYSYVEPFYNGEDITVAQDDAWIFNPDYLDWYQNFLIHKAGTAYAHYDSYAAQSPPPEMFSEEFSESQGTAKNIVKDTELLINRYGKLNYNVSWLRERFQQKAIFASGQHLLEGHVMLERVYEALKVSGSN